MEPSAIKIYKSDMSPPARAVMMACDVLNIPFEPIEVNLPEKEHLSPGYLKKNPLHTIPVLEDGDLIIQDSHAMLMYLSDKYGKDDKLYPKDLNQRALVNQKLFFDIGILYARLRSIAKAAFYEGAKSPTEQQERDVYEAYSFLEEFLARSKYLANDSVTIADLSAITYVTTLVYVLPLEAAKYPKTAAWIKDMEEKPFCQKYNACGTVLLGERIKNNYITNNLS